MQTDIDFQQFKKSVYEIVSQIPKGRVLTYGDIARLAGRPNHARFVGHLMGTVPHSQHLPCHRVVNAKGRLAPKWPKQKELLAAEGVKTTVDKQGRTTLDLRCYRWQVFSNHPF